jgi:hypothetical protein
MTYTTHTTFAPSAPSIASSAMLVELGISIWTAKKKDKAATADLLADKRASKAAGNFNKNLLADCEELASIQKFASNVRTMHYNMTMPWSDSGLRLLPTAKFFAYQAAMTKLQDEFDRLVDNFIAAYDWQVAQVHAKLGDLFDRDEYPTADTVRHKFAMRLNYIPVPEAGDWRVDMNAEAQSVLHEQYANFYKQQTERAMRDVWERLHKQLTTFVRQLGVDEEGKKGKIFDSTIENVRELTEMLAHCNFTNDPNLNLAQQKLEMAIAGVCRDDLVRNEGFREDTRAAMEEALRALPGLGGWDE